MPTYQTPAIVIGRTNFGEADRIIRLLSRDHGKISAVAKGVRKIKSRLSGHLEPFAETNLTLATGRNLDVVTGARLIWYPHELATDYQRINLGYSFTTLIDRVAADGEPQPQLYAHLASALRVLNDTGPGPLLELWFKLRLLALTGLRPQLNHCATCATDSQDQSYALSNSGGGLVCRADAHPGDPALSHDAVKLWRLLSDYPYVTVAQIAGGPQLSATTLPAANGFISFHLGTRPDL